MRAPVITREMLGDGLGWETWLSWRDVRDCGARGDGVTDDTAAIAAMLEAAQDGDVIYFSPGNYLISSAFADIVHDVSIIGYNATISASVRLTAPVFRWDTRDDFVVSGLTYDGAETYASFDKGTDDLLVDIYGLIWLEACDNVKISNINGLECRNLIYLNTCTNCVIDKAYHVGVLNVVKADANYHPTVVIREGNNNKVYNIHSEDGGSCVLGLNLIERLLISGCDATNLWDNGIYISTGNRITIVNNHFHSFADGTQYGIKTRGSNMLIAHNQLTDMRNGIRATNLSAEIGADNIVIEANIVETYAHRAIDITNAYDGPFPSNVIISNNTMYDGTGVGGTADAIQARVIKGLSITGNIIDGNDADYAIYAYGADEAEAEEIVIANNILKDVAGEGVRLFEVDRGQFSNNVFESVTGYGFRLMNVTNSIFMGNLKLDDGQEVIRDTTVTFTNTGNIYAFNYGMVNVDAGAQILNRLINNYPVGTIAMEFGAADATPDVEGGSMFLTNAAGALDVTDFDNPDRGQVITILGADGGNTTVKHNVILINLVGGADWVSNDGASLVLWYDGADWCEISRAAPTMA